MPGPILSRLLNRDNQEEENSLLLQRHRRQILEQMDSAGGCCGATEVAGTIRRSGQKYD